jgi:hypothetical protein
VQPVDDLRQARELAMLICSSEDAVETFIAHCDVAARDLLMPFGDVVMALSIVLRIKRTLNGAEIDELISDVQARKKTGDRTCATSRLAQTRAVRPAAFRRNKITLATHRRPIPHMIGWRDCASSIVELADVPN